MSNKSVMIIIKMNNNMGGEYRIETFPVWDCETYGEAYESAYSWTNENYEGKEFQIFMNREDIGSLVNWVDEKRKISNK